jgi:hypothetical protein
MNGKDGIAGSIPAGLHTNQQLRPGVTPGLLHARAAVVRVGRLRFEMPGFAAYEQRTRRQIPVVILERREGGRESAASTS